LLGLHRFWNGSCHNGLYEGASACPTDAILMTPETYRAGVERIGEGYFEVPGTRGLVRAWRSVVKPGNVTCEDGPLVANAHWTTLRMAVEADLAAMPAESDRAVALRDLHHRTWVAEARAYTGMLGRVDAARDLCDLASAIDTALAEASPVGLRREWDRAGFHALSENLRSFYIPNASPEPDADDVAALGALR
jgi:hypothetical protein